LVKPSGIDLIELSIIFTPRDNLSKNRPYLIKAKTLPTGWQKGKRTRFLNLHIKQFGKLWN